MGQKNISHIEQNAKSRLAKKRALYLRKKLSFSDLNTYFPAGLETLFLLVYILLLPYIAGLIFLLLFFSRLNITIMQSIFNAHSFFLTWCVGYEILAISFLLYLLKKFVFIK